MKRYLLVNIVIACMGWCWLLVLLALWPRVADAQWCAATTATFALGVCCDDEAGTTGCVATVCTIDGNCTGGQVCAGASGEDGYTQTDESGVYPPTPLTTNTTGITSQPTRSLGGGWYTVRNLLVRWDTSSLPDGAILSAARLRAGVGAITNTDSLNLTADWYDWSPAIDTGDHSHAPGTDAISGIALSTLSTGANQLINLDNTTGVSLTGTTYLRMHISQRASDAAPTGENLWRSSTYDHTTNKGLQFEVCYTMPRRLFAPILME